MRSEGFGFWGKNWARRAGAALLLSLGLSACASPGPYIWVDSLPLKPPVQTQVYTIEDGDLLDIHVLNEERVSGKVRVRPDGRVTLPLLGDMFVRGKTPLNLSRELETALQRYIKEPVVTLGLEETHSLRVTVLGEVAHPGVFVLPTNAGVMQALASAGGLTDFAERDSIYVLQSARNTRVRFKYDALLDNQAKSTGFVLLDGDVVAVE
jgi:polysaccharide export outer membrane protein